MKRKYFTNEELTALRENPYTQHVTRAQIRFTEEFNEAFWRKRCEGFTIQEAFESCGYEFEMFGKKRVEAIARKIRAAAAGGVGNDGSSNKDAHAEDEKDQKARIRELEAKVEYLDHQMEWIKKVMSVRGTARQERC